MEICVKLFYFYIFSCLFFNRDFIVYEAYNGGFVKFYEAYIDFIHIEA